MVGLYGDPDTSWGICAELMFDTPIFDLPQMTRRLAAMCRDHPRLGLAPQPQSVSPDLWRARRADVASRPYREGEPLLRILVDPGTNRLLVGAHHGVVDGLGLIALASHASGVPLRPEARGIGHAEAPRGFLLSSARRLVEALVAPPLHFRGTSSGDESKGEHISTRVLARSSGGTAALLTAVLRVVEVRRATNSRRPLFIVGASRRAPGGVEPDRQTAFIRVRTRKGWSLAEVQGALDTTMPEPSFPETSVGGIGPWITRKIRGRLGSTAAISNLGVISGDGVREVAMFPAASGPSAVALGFASTSETTVLSLRTRTNEFSREEHDAILKEICRAYRCVAE